MHAGPVYPEHSLLPEKNGCADIISVLPHGLYQDTIMVISLYVQTSHMLQKVSVTIAFSIILLLVLSVMAPVSARGVPVAAATTQVVPANGTFIQTPVSTGTVTTAVTSLPVTTGAAAVGTALSSTNGTSSGSPASVDTTPPLVVGSETSAPVTPTVLSTAAAEPTTTSPVSVPTVIAGIGIAGLAMMLIKRH
jgi:hypothetical protein